MLAPDGRLAGVGSLNVGDAKAGLPGNMFVPIDHLRPVMGDLLALGRPSTPPRPWLGVNLQELDGKLVVGHLALDGPGDRAGIRRGDWVTALDGIPVHDLADFYRTLWRRGEAGITVRLSLARQGEAQCRGQNHRPLPLPEARDHLLNGPGHLRHPRVRGSTRF